MQRRALRHRLERRFTASHRGKRGNFQTGSATFPLDFIHATKLRQTFPRHHYELCYCSRHISVILNLDSKMTRREHSSTETRGHGDPRDNFLVGHLITWVTAFVKTLFDWKVIMPNSPIKRWFTKQSLTMAEPLIQNAPWSWLKQIGSYALVELKHKATKSMTGLAFVALVAYFVYYFVSALFRTLFT